MKKIIFSILFVFFSSFSFSQMQTPLEKFISADNLASAAVSVLIQDIQTGEKLVEHNAYTNRNPASLTKLLTTATAVEMLTDTFRFETQIEYDGMITEDSVLNGNIYIIGGGDPTLESVYCTMPNNFYVKSAEAIRNLGIQRINGRIIGDATLFQEHGSPFQWLVEDIGSYYAPTPSALSVHDNILQLTLRSDSNLVSLESVLPPTGLLFPKMDFKVGGTETAWRISKTDFSWQPVFRGTLPFNKQLKIRTEMPEPALFVADSLANLLRIIGIPVDSASATVRMNNGIPDSTRVLLYTYYSGPLKNIIKSTNYRSINLYAENIFNYLALQKCDIASTQVAANVVAAYWKGKGLPVKRIFQSDGSGISMKNAITADFFVQLLVYMKTKAKYGHSFFASLPTAGVSGTVTSFMSGTGLSGKAHLKTGSMERVQNYGGYIRHKNKWYAFCVMVNNYGGDRATVQKQVSLLLNEVFK